MSYIHFKLVSNTNYDKITFDGVSLTLGQLKKYIFEKAKFTKRFDYDLEIKNADTKEVYKNETDLIQKNTRVHVSRIIKNASGPLRSTTTSLPQQQHVVSVPQPIVATQQTVVTSVTTSTPAVTVSQTTPTTISDIKPSIEAPQSKATPTALVASKPVSTVTPEIRMESYKKGITLSDISITRASTIPTEQKFGLRSPQRPVPPNYICPYCKKPGHFKHACPDVASGLVPKEDNRPKYPTGIPKSFMIKANAGDPGAMLGPEGHVIPKLDHQAFKVVKRVKTPFLTEEEEEELKKTQQEEAKTVETIPSELTCPFIEQHGKHLIKEAVLVPCCGHFICCDECIREKILKDEQFECPVKGCGHEIDSLESITPHHQMRKMVHDYLNDIKLNKIKNNKSTSNKSDEAFIDLLLNDDFNVAAATTTTTITTTVNHKLSPIMGQSTANQFTDDSSSCSREETLETEIYNDFIETKPSEHLEAPLSPVQDSKIASSTLSGGGGVSTCMQNSILTTDGVKIMPSSEIQTPIQTIPALHTPLHVKYPYGTKGYGRSPMRISSYGMGYGHADTSINTPPSTTSTSTTSSVHYPLSSSIYSYRNMSQQPYTPISYTPYGTVPTSYVQQSPNLPILSERQFYECQERLRREQTHVHEFGNDLIVKKRRRSRSRSRSTSSRSHRTTDSYHSHKETTIAKKPLSSSRGDYEKNRSSSSVSHRRHRRHRSRSKSKSSRQRKSRSRSRSPLSKARRRSSSSSSSSSSATSIELEKKKSKSSRSESKTKLKKSISKEDKHKKSKKKHKHKSKSRN